MVVNSLQYRNLTAITVKYKKVLEQTKKIKSRKIDFKNICNNCINAYNDGIDVLLNLMLLIDVIRKKDNVKDIETLITICDELKETYFQVAVNISESIVSFFSKISNVSKTLALSIYNKYVKSKETSGLELATKSILGSQDVDYKDLQDNSKIILKCCNFIFELNSLVDTIVDLKQLIEDNIKNAIMEQLSDIYVSLEEMSKTNKKIKDNIC